MPTPAALASGEFDLFGQDGDALQHTRVPVLCATNRIPAGSAGDRAYTIFASDDIRLGVANFWIGDDKLDWPSLVALSSGSQAEGRPRIFLEQIDEWLTLDVADGEGPLPPAAQRYFEAVNSRGQDRW